MPASSAALSVATSALADEITHVALVNGSGAQVGDRVATTATATGANVRLAADATFDVPAGATVAGWTAHDASTGGTDLGGEDLTPETYAGDGQYVLTGSATGYTISAV